jgi:hypothetical protein
LKHGQLVKKNGSLLFDQPAVSHYKEIFLRERMFIRRRQNADYFNQLYSRAPTAFLDPRDFRGPVAVRRGAAPDKPALLRGTE